MKEKTPPKSPRPPSKSPKSLPLPQHPLPNPKVKTFNPFSPCLFPKLPTQSGGLYGPLELRVKRLLVCETPCETTGEFMDFSNITKLLCKVTLSFTPYPLCFGSQLFHFVKFHSQLRI